MRDARRASWLPRIPLRAHRYLEVGAPPLDVLHGRMFTRRGCTNVMGTACAVNAVLQMLYHAPPLLCCLYTRGETAPSETWRPLRAAMCGLSHVGAGVPPFNAAALVKHLEAHWQSRGGESEADAVGRVDAHAVWCALLELLRVDEPLAATVETRLVCAVCGHEKVPVDRVQELAVSAVQVAAAPNRPLYNTIVGALREEEREVACETCGGDRAHTVHCVAMALGAMVVVHVGWDGYIHARTGGLTENVRPLWDTAYRRLGGVRCTGWLSTQLDVGEGGKRLLGMLLFQPKHGDDDAHYLFAGALRAAAHVAGVVGEVEEAARELGCISAEQQHAVCAHFHVAAEDEWVIFDDERTERVASVHTLLQRVEAGAWGRVTLPRLVVYG